MDKLRNRLATAGAAVAPLLLLVVETAPKLRF